MPLLFFVSLLVLSFVLVKYGITGVIEQNKKFSDANKLEQTLATKERFLSTFGREISLQVQSSNFAVPSQNTVFSVLPRIRIAAADTSILLTTITIGRPSQDENGLSRISITISAQGSKDAIFQFVKSVLAQAPIVTLENLTLDESTEGVSEVTVTFSSYWATLPSKLPKLEEPIAELSDGERNTLAKIIGLSTPTFGAELAPQAPSSRVDPFGL